MNLAVTPSEPVLAIVLPVALDGSLGTNRAKGAHKQIAADTDVEAVRLWLAEYSASPHTLRSYRKEAVRLLLWATQALGKPLSSLTREDFLHTSAFWQRRRATGSIRSGHAADVLGDCSRGRCQSAAYIRRWASSRV